MAILNYTTQISTDKTIGEISRLLTKAKVQSVLTDYDPDGVLRALSFRIQTRHGLLSFRLPANVDRIHRVIAGNKKIAAKLRTREQAARVAWRIIKDWLEAQLALVSAEMVDLEQVFLPYVQDDAGRTLYEALDATHFAGLALPGGRK